MSSDAKIEAMLRNLARFLAEKLENHAIRKDQSQIAKEEKKLLAELAGHCLPLADPPSNHEEIVVAQTQPLSLFEMICRETFDGTLKSLFGEDKGISRSITTRRIVGAKAALYSVCHHVPLARDDEAGEPLLYTASFAIDILGYQMNTGSNELSESDAKEISMLQSGCMQYLAVCFDSLSFRMIKRGQPNSSPKLIIEIETGNESESSKARTCSILTALASIMSSVKSILSSVNSSTRDASLLHQKTRDPSASRRLSPAALTSILNSIALLSQNTRNEDSRLDWFAAEMMPTLVAFLNFHPADEESSHPLCVAASLQAAYTLLARLGSFDWLSSDSRPCSDGGNRRGEEEEKEEDFVCGLLRGALKSFKERSGDGDDDVDDVAASTLRLAASKLMLATIAIYKSRSGTTTTTTTRGNGIGLFLDRAEVREAMSELRGAANVDRNPEVRRLMAEAIPGLVRILDGGS